VIPAELLAAHVERQRWFPGGSAAGARIAQTASLRDGWPMLVQVLIDVAGRLHQVLAGIRPDGEAADFLHGRAGAVIGPVFTPEGPGFAYDAMADPELCVHLLGLVAPGEAATRARPVGSEQTNTSVVYDDRLILKLFRTLEPGPNPEVEVTAALAGAGCPHVARPVAAWRRGELDLAVVHEFLGGGAEGWALALTSLRDLLGEPHLLAPGEAGGDFAGEAERLGAMTAALHGALAGVFGRRPADVPSWAAGIEREVRGVAGRLSPAAAEAAGRVIERLRGVDDPGPAIRVHGDYHLGQVLRTDRGWHVIDFEGEPVLPLAQRRAFSSPLRDVAGMLRSFQYAASVALRESDGGAAALAEAWEARNREAFLDGYLSAAEEARLLPAGADAWHAVLGAFELGKAAYEVSYELAHRPDWATIPLRGLERLLGS
jgi:maltokinase